MARRSRANVREAADSAREALLANHAEMENKKDERLGDILLYDLTDGYRGKAKKVATVFEAHGLVAKHVLPVPADWPVAFGRAMEIIGAKIRTQDWRLMDASKGEKGERRVGIIYVERNSVVTTEHKATVVCPTARDGRPPFIEDGRGKAREIAQDIIDHVANLHEVYTIDDIRSAVVQHVDRWYGLPMKRKPPYVVYWVPAAGGDEIRKLRDAVEALGAGHVELMTIYKSDPEAKRAVVNSVNKGLEAQLNEFRDQVKMYTSKPADSTRVSTMEQLVEEAQQLRAQGGLYRDILGVAIDSVDAQYKQIETTLKRHLGVVETVHAEEATA